MVQRERIKSIFFYQLWSMWMNLNVLWWVTQVQPSFLPSGVFSYYVLMFSLQIEFLQLFLNITLHLESYREKQCFELLICNLINFKLVKSELQNQITKLYQSIWNLNPFLNPKLAGGGRRLAPPSPLVFLPYHSNF